MQIRMAKKEKLKQFFKTYLKKAIDYFKNWKMLLSFGIAWMITNGWSYIFIGLGIWLKIGWMWKVGTSYLAFLWLPFTPEKLITIPLSILVHKIIFNKKKKGEKIL